MNKETAENITNKAESKCPLPKGWRWVKLVEVCDFLDSRRIPVNETERLKRMAGKKQSELYPYYGANGQVGWIDDYLFDEPLILLAEDGGNFGSREKPIAYSVSGRYWVNNHAHVLRPKSDINFDYCLFSLSIRPDVGELVSGSTRAKLNQEIASTIQIPLPPLPEQKRIAAILNEQMADVEKARKATEQQLEAAKALPAAYLREVFNSPEAKKWPRKKLGEVCSLKRGPFGGSLKKEIFVKDGYKVYEQRHAINNNFEIGEYYIDETKYNVMIDFAIKPNDLIVSCSGTMGKIAIVPANAEKGIINQALLKLAPNLGLIAPAFLKSTLECNEIQNQYFRNTSGSAIKNVASVKVLKSIWLPVPPLSEQERISSILSEHVTSAVQLRKSLEEQLGTINKLPAALLKRAFNGEL